MVPTVTEMDRSDWIDGRIAPLGEPDLPWGARLYAIVDEISNQEDVVASFNVAPSPDVPGLTFASKYLAALRGAKDELLAEATGSGSEVDDEAEMVYWAVHAAIVRERAGRTPAPIDLASFYREFRDRYFDGSVPELSQDFVCIFSKLPFDASGICYLEKEASGLGITPGIRINEKFKEFPAEAKVALLHEMIHAAGVRKHEHDFKLALIELFGKRAYLDPLIL